MSHFQQVLTIKNTGSEDAYNKEFNEIGRILRAGIRHGGDVTVIITTDPTALAAPSHEIPETFLRQQAWSLRRIALQLGFTSDAMVRAFGRKLSISPATSSRLFNEQRVLTIKVLNRLRQLCVEAGIDAEHDLSALARIARP